MIFALLIAAILPHDSAARDTFDQIEVQFTHCWQGLEKENGDVDFILKPVFCQLLFRRFEDTRGTHVIEAWRMAKEEMKYGYNHARQVHEIRWFDGQVERCVETKSLVRSAADFDSEVIERDMANGWPKEWRRDLLKPAIGRKGRE